MTLNEFVNLFNGKATDFDKGSGVQCVDLAKMYIYYVLGINPQSIGNAEAYWRRYNELSYLHDNFNRIPNTASFVPQKGDIAVWDKRHGKYGHIAICTGEGTTSYFYSYDQNWIIKKMHKVKHSYKDGFAGVLRPKDQAKINGQKMKYKIGQKVLFDIPVAFTGSYEGNNMLVESNGYFFWIDKSVVQNYARVYGLGKVLAIENGIYKCKIFDNEFYCKEEYMTDKF